MSGDRTMRPGARDWPVPTTARPVAPASAQARPDPAELYAALDLGTNSCRMLIAQPKGN